jgi:cation/acetate symporter
MVGGLIFSLVLVLLGPDVLGKDDAIFPLAIPALVTVPAGFLLAYVGTLIGAGRVGSTGMPYEEFEQRAFAPDEAPRDGGRFTRRAEEPERVGAT